MFLCHPLNVVTWWILSSGYGLLWRLLNYLWISCFWDLFSKGQRASRAIHDLLYEEDVVSRRRWSVGGNCTGCWPTCLLRYLVGERKPGRTYCGWVSSQHELQSFRRMEFRAFTLFYVFSVCVLKDMVLSVSSQCVQDLCSGLAELRSSWCLVVCLPPGTGDGRQSLVFRLG